MTTRTRSGRGVDLLSRMRREGTPLIDGDRATFVRHGRDAPLLVGDFTHWEHAPLHLRPAGESVWTRTLSFYEDAYVEYAYVDARGKRRRDPLNAHPISNGVGATNQAFYMPRGSPTPLVRRRSDAPAGRIERHVLRAEPFVARRRRAVDLYAPAARGPWPLLVVFDGNDYGRRAKLATIADNLIAAGRTRPFAMALVHHGRDARVIEYASNDVTLQFVLDHVLALARSRLDLMGTRGAHAVLGASMGGLMALFAALRAPEIFGAVISQSGAFGSWTAREPVVFDLVRSLPPRLRRIWMDVGHLEYLAPSNRRMRRLLASRGYDVAYREFHGGHNWTAWRNEVWRGLEFVFGTRARSAR